MRIVVGIVITFLVASCQCWLPFVYEPVNPEDPHYIAMLKHALEIVGASPVTFRITEYLVKDDIVESSHKVAYYNSYGQMCHITFIVNSVAGTQVPAIPVCNYGVPTSAKFALPAVSHNHHTVVHHLPYPAAAPFFPLVFR